MLGGGELEELRELGVPEVVVTFGAGGLVVLTRDAAVRVPARPASGDPTGAGDAFSVAVSERTRRRPPAALRRAPRERARRRPPYTSVTRKDMS